MSRGHGRAQRAVVDALCADETARKEGLPLAALPLPPDRSNRRRVIKTLVQRGDLEVVDDPETGERRLRPSFVAALQATWRIDPPKWGKKGDTERRLAQELRALEEAANELVAMEAQKRRGRIMADRARWAEPGGDLKRYRRPGPHQTRVIAVLVRYAESPQEGLPRAAVRQIAALDSGEANANRALDRLVERGTLQPSRDGERVRLTNWGSFLLALAPDLLEPPLDDAQAQAILEGFDEGRGSHVSGGTS